MYSIEDLAASLAIIERMDGELEVMRQQRKMPIILYPLIVTIRASLLGLMAFLDAEMQDLKDESR